MSLMTVQFFGLALSKQTTMHVLMPDGRKGPFPVLYLLHGLSDDHSIWLRRTRIEAYLNQKPLIVVMPDGARSFYINSPSAGDYEDYMVRDVVGYMDRVFPTVKQARGRAAAGLSMGGFGALLLGLKHPDVFSAVSAHSSAILPPEKLAERPALRPIIPFLKKKENDIFALARQAARRRNRPALRLDCGLDDTLLDGSRRFHAHLEKIGYPHRYDEHPGNHNWDYWDEYVRETLDFVLAHTRRQERRIG